MISHYGEEPITLRQILSVHNRKGKQVRLIDTDGNPVGNVFVINIIDDKISCELLDRKWYRISIIYEGSESLVLKVQENY